MSTHVRLLVGGCILVVNTWYILGYDVVLYCSDISDRSLGDETIRKVCGTDINSVDTFPISKTRVNIKII